MAAGTFAWNSALDVGLGVIQGLFAGSASRAVARAENQIRAANNKIVKSKNDLAATIKSINDKNVMRAAGKQYNAAITNAGRMAEAYMAGNFEQTIRDAEQVGAFMASGAARGLAGTTSRAAEYSAALSQARAAVGREKAQGRALYDATKQAAGYMQNAYASLDRSYNYDRLDTMEPARGMSVFDSILTGLMSKSDSLHTMLGSIGQGQQGQTQGGAVATPVQQGSATPYRLPPISAVASPVYSSQLTSYQINPIIRGM